jgi:energy-coupling factor transporter transmembrane protein EcfT
MQFRGPGRTYLVSRAVEEPIDASFELGEEIQKLSGRLSTPVNLGIIATIIFMIFLLPNLLYYSTLIIYTLLGRLEHSSTWIRNASIFCFILVLILAFVITNLLYLSQIRKFNTHLIQRYSAVANLKLTPDSQESNTEIGRDVKYQPGKKRSGAKSKKHIQNPIFAMLDLVEESMHELPQLVKLLRFCVYFITIILVFLVVTFILGLFLTLGSFLGITLFGLVTNFVTFVLFIPTLIFLLDLENLVVYLQTRHEIIDNVRFQTDLSVPTGDDQITRLIKYLSQNDPFIAIPKDAKMPKFNRDVKLMGRSNNKHHFNAFFTTLNNNEYSYRLGIPQGKLAVFIKIFKKPIKLSDIHAMRKAVIDVSTREKVFPLRVIALQWQVAELDEKVYNYALEKPMVFDNTIAHLQIVAEDGELYSFIPMISYGRADKLR